MNKPKKKANRASTSFSAAEIDFLFEVLTAVDAGVPAKRLAQSAVMASVLRKIRAMRLRLQQR